MNPQRFGELLTKGIYAIKSREGRQVSLIEDELGYALGRNGGSSIIHWRRGNIPTKAKDIEILAQVIVQRGCLDQTWLEEFYHAAGYAEQKLTKELFGIAKTKGLPQQVNPQEAIITVRNLVEQHNFLQAVPLLISHCEQFIKQEGPQKVLDLLTYIPPTLVSLFPELSYVFGLIYIETEQPDQAILFLQKVKTYYAQHANIDGLIKCYLELIHIYQKREDFQTAFLYVQDASYLAEKTSNALSKITFLIRLGELCPDIGKLAEGTQYLEQAVQLIRLYPDLKYEEFRILCLLSLLYRQLGQYRDANSWLEMAKQLYKSGGISPTRYPDLLNSEAHIHWYMGNIEQALDRAIQLREAVDNLNLGKRRIYARMLLGNLQRAFNQYATASAFYEDAKRITVEEDFPLFLPWVYSQQAWLALLMGNYTDARRFIFTALETTDQGQRMSFNITLAILNSLQEEYSSALELLETSHIFYVNSGDKLTISIIHLYSAYIYYKTNNPSEAALHLEEALAWFYNNNIIYSPLWWHPYVLSQTLAYALVQQIHPSIAERMLVKLFSLSDTKFINTIKYQSDNNFMPFIIRILDMSLAPDKPRPATTPFSFNGNNDTTISPHLPAFSPLPSTAVAMDEKLP